MTKVCLRCNLLNQLLLFLLLAGTFFVLDLQSVPTGDDLGYMFTDSTHHLGDGHRVQSLGDITKTLSSHYLTTNGRFLVHWIAMFFLNIGGHVSFCAANSIVFFLTALFFTRLAGFPKPYQFGTVVLSTIILWFCVPLPGLNWLSLVCYATNYLWPTCATLAFLLFFERLIDQGKGTVPSKMSCCLALIFSLVTGSLQESFSLPVSAGLLALWIMEGKSFSKAEMALTITFWIGTSICVFAPGNLHHAAQGGGFASTAMIHKLSALGIDLLTKAPLITIAAIIGLWGLLFKREATVSFLRANIVIAVSIVVALLLASVSFTSSRQLTCPGVLSGILLLRVLRKSIDKGRLETVFNLIGSTVGLTAYILCFVGAYTVRYVTSEALRSVHMQAAEGKEILVYDLAQNQEMKWFGRIFYRFNFSQLPVIFDGYTKRGLSRLYSSDEDPKYITTILPVDPEKIEQVAKKSVGKDGSIIPQPFEDKYMCYLVPFGYEPRVPRDAEGNSLPYESFLTSDGKLYVFSGKYKGTTPIR